MAAAVAAVAVAAVAGGGGGQGAAGTPEAVASPAVAGSPQTWHVLVNNVSPAGENWSFNSFYPDHLQAHPGDTIVFTLAPNPNAFHTVMVLIQGETPLEMYQGFAGGFVQPNPNQTGPAPKHVLRQPRRARRAAAPVRTRA